MLVFLNRLSLLFLASVFLSGCASIVSGQNQGVAIKTTHLGKNIVGATCELENDDGKWLVTTPNTVTVDRSAQNLSVICKKENLAPGIVSIKSKTKNMAWGNVLFGGIIGAGIDIETGAAFDYPTIITVEMEKTVEISDKK